MTFVSSQLTCLSVSWFECCLCALILRVSRISSVPDEICPSNQVKIMSTQDTIYLCVGSRARLQSEAGFALCQRWDLPIIGGGTRSVVEEKLACSRKWARSVYLGLRLVCVGLSRVFVRFLPYRIKSAKAIK